MGFMDVLGNNVEKREVYYKYIFFEKIKINFGIQNLYDERFEKFNMCLMDLEKKYLILISIFNYYCF